MVGERYGGIGAGRRRCGSRARVLAVFGGFVERASERAARCVVERLIVEPVNALDRPGDRGDVPRVRARPELDAGLVTAGISDGDDGVARTSPLRERVGLH